MNELMTFTELLPEKNEQNNVMSFSDKVLLNFRNGNNLRQIKLGHLSTRRVLKSYDVQNYCIVGSLRKWNREVIGSCVTVIVMIMICHYHGSFLAAKTFFNQANDTQTKFGFKFKRKYMCVE